MSWAQLLVLAVVAVAAFAAGFAVAALSRSSRIARVTEGLSELARGNLAHRVILPGDDEASRAADAVNSLADDIQRQRESASARDAAQRRLLANISHDLRTPVASIAGYTDALRRGLGDEPERYLSVIAAKADDLAQLTDDLFYAARIDAGDLELHRGPVDLAEAVRRSVLGFEPQLAGAGARVEVRVPDRRCMIEGDRSAIARILSNLVSNSVRHAAAPTSLTVSMGEAPGAWEVVISNDGPPLPEDVERLFERGVAGPAGGTGLGLSIARELAERMGGSVSAANSPDRRVSFSLTMPRSEFNES
jgi:signal transduction histidine kinase